MKQAEFHQPEALQQALKNNSIGKQNPDSEDVTVLADMPVHVIDGSLYYCRMNFEKARMTHLAGDKGEFIPSDVALVGAEDLDFEDGYYRLNNAMITLNGHVEVRFTEETEMVLETEQAFNNS